MTKRTSIAVATVASGALLLSACVPPNENPSDIKVDTATEQSEDTLAGDTDSTSTSDAATTTSVEAAAATEVTYIDCVATPATEPEEITLDCTDTDNVVTDITWSAWTEDYATGEGTDIDGNVTAITLSSPQATGEDVTFTTLTVNGVTVTP